MFLQRSLNQNQPSRVTLEAAGMFTAASSAAIDGVYFLLDTTQLLIGSLANPHWVGATILRRLGVTRTDVQVAILIRSAS